LELMQTEGAHILTVLEDLLEETYLSGCLSAGKDNMIIVSLAAPDGFNVDEDALRDTISKKLLTLGVDTYLKIIVAGPGKAVEAKRMKIPLNALLLGEAMKDMIIEGEDHAFPEGVPPQPVWDLLQSVNPGHIFSQDEFIPGESGKGGRKPERSVPPINIPVEKRDGGEEKELSDGRDNDHSEPVYLPEPIFSGEYMLPEKIREYP
jgi:hypothetical protein